MNPSRRKIVAGGIAALAVAGGGAAIAASQLDSPSQRSAAIVNDAANQLGVQPGALSDALKNAEKKQIDAAVAAGQMTKEQGDAAKAAIDSGKAPLVNVGPVAASTIAASAAGRAASAAGWRSASAASRAGSTPPRRTSA